MRALRPSTHALLLLAALTAPALPAAAQCGAPGAGSGAIRPAPAAPAPPAPDAPGPASPARPGAAPGACAPRPAPASPAQAPGPPAAFPGQPTTPFGDAFDTTWWALWWEHNKVAYLDLDRLRTRQPITGPMEKIDPLVLARRGLTWRAVYQDLVPELLEQLEGARDSALIGELLVALARIGEAPRLEGCDAPPPLRPRLAAFLGDGNPAVRERAALALGLLGDPASVSMLGELVVDSRAGRELVGGGRVDLRLRAQAAHALGLAAARGERFLSRYVVHVLGEVLAGDPAGTDLEAACIAALGVTRLERVGSAEDDGAVPGASRSALVAAVLARMEGRDRGEPARIHAPTALARLASDLPEHAAMRRAAIERLIDAADPRSKERDPVRRSAVLALGMLGDADGEELDREVRRVLDAAARNGDLTTRGFALVALGQVAGRPGSGPAPFAASAEVEADLVARLVRGQGWSRPWAALGLGVLGHGRRQHGELLEPRTADVLLESLRESRSTITTPALALAVGLLGDERGRVQLQNRLRDLADEEARAACALGLGLMDTREARGVLAEVQAEAGHWPRLAESAALARRLLGDDGVRADLVATLASCDCQRTVLSAARGLAWTGDAAAVPELRAILRDADRPASVRAAATLALGWLADDELVPFDAVYSVGANYADAPSTLTDPLGHGLLDLF